MLTGRLSSLRMGSGAGGLTLTVSKKRSVLLCRGNHYWGTYNGTKVNLRTFYFVINLPDATVFFITLLAVLTVTVSIHKLAS